MSATAVVAIVGAISTPVVAIAGYFFNHVTSRSDREAARQLAKDAHDHELEVRRRERAYEDRKSAYRAALTWALVAVQRVELTEPVLSYEGMPEAPEAPGDDEWRDLHVEIHAFGSEQVDQAFQSLLDKLKAFYGYVMSLRLIRAQGGRATQDEPWKEVVRTRTEVHDAYDALRRRIRDELASL